MKGDTRVKRLSLLRNPLLWCMGMFICVANSSGGQTVIKGRRVLQLESRTAQLMIDLAGGSFTSFHLRGQSLSPIHWGETAETPEPRPMGHFLCLDRWGQPSEAEEKNGMPFHGEASRVNWEVLQAPQDRESGASAEMGARLPMAGLKVKRTVALSNSGAFFRVTEQVTNVNKLGRLFNMVQHPTIGPPFLSEDTVVDSNARKGLMQSSPLPNPEEPSVVWPEGRKEGQIVNLRYLTDDHNPNVVSFTIDEDYGWVTACNATEGLLIGYLWKTSEYPWFSAWRHTEKGKPTARGLEFGTTGLHQPFPILVAKGQIFGRPLYEYLDANETRSKSYVCFLFQIPKDYKGVSRLTYDGKEIVLHAREAGKSHDLKMEIGELSPPSHK